jgi:hypothetical protein
MRKLTLGCLLLALTVTPLAAQQTGSITGRVTVEGGEPLGGVMVSATSPVLPQPRTTTTDGRGVYRLPQLTPGDYEIAFTMDEMGSARRSLKVLLDTESTVDVELSPEGISEEVTVVAAAEAIDRTSAELKTAMAEDVIQQVPIGREFRDLVKLIPGVQVTADRIRGPSAGGSGQDNAYQFDGVNVTLPLFGTLSADPSSHDIEQISVVKGGAKAVDFNRAGGFTINSVSKSGTNAFKGEVGYQIQPESLTSDRKPTGSITSFNQDEDWLTGSIGGPILRDSLYFYASAYRPTTTQEGRVNNYGAVPDLETERDEYFGKLSFAPTESILLSGSYRTSERDESGRGVAGTADAGSTSRGDDSELDIAIAEGSWIINDKSYASFKYTDFENQTAATPDNLLGLRISDDGTVGLDVNALDTQGLLTVPTPSTNPTVNAFLQPFINRYGFLNPAGVRTGGGTVGAASTITDNDFFRESAQVGYDLMLGSNIRHNLHFGFQYTLDEEDLARRSNGWGSISVLGGTACPANSTCAGQLAFFQARFHQQTLDSPRIDPVPVIHSEYKSQSFEVNDTMQWGDWSFNLGLLASNDKFYGQGLRNDSSTISGFSACKSCKYLMHEIDFEDTLSPRLGAVWAYSGPNTVYANYARYVPPASSLPRAASWARNAAVEVSFFFDQTGRFIGSTPEAATSGKLFDDELDPRTVDEYMIGTSRQIGPRWTARAHGRYRYGYNYWEDTNNTARTAFNPPAGIPRELYIPDLSAKLAQIGSGSSYVIAELDGAFTKYYEASLEGEWRGNNAMFRGSYVWSHYYGNFDQDNTTGVDNDLSLFIGSSNIADGIGRQLWDNKYGNLRGDRRHQLKLFGYYGLPWNASVGAFAVYQSGQPWEVLDARVYIPNAAATATTHSNRFAEPAGSRDADDHYQLDVNYTHSFLVGGFEIEGRVDLFNAFDRQTGYDIQPATVLADFGLARRRYQPRRLQLGIKFRFG